MFNPQPKSQALNSTTKHREVYQTNLSLSILNLLHWLHASYTWDTSNITVAPSTPIYYYWQITDAEGNKLRTPEQLIHYDDFRFDWQELRSPEIILRWYEGDTGFGNKIFDVANRALAQMKGETNLELDFPVIILLYANDEDFNSWLFYSHDWVGGMAFPSLGITTQILPSSSNLSWIENVIPHEIAHLFFFQVINADIYFWPSWLDEGLAQYYEFSDNEVALERVVQAAHDKALLPLVLISGDFGSDPEQAYLAYDQSYSVVFYMLETWGQDGLQKLIANFREGMGYREAVEGAYQISWEEFEAGWITWLGVPTTPAPPPTPTVSLLLMLTPSATQIESATQVSQADGDTHAAPLTETPEIGMTEEVEADLNPLQRLDKPSGLFIIGVLIVLVLIPAILINAINKRASKDN